MKFRLFIIILSLLTACQQKKQTQGWIDLTHNMDENSVRWPTGKAFTKDTIFHGHTDNQFFYSAFNLSFAEHIGTHMDAPYHFGEKRQKIQEIPLEHMIGPAVVVDVSGRALQDRDYQILPQDFLDWEQENGQLPENIIVLIRTGYGKYYNEREKYLGTNIRGETAIKYFHFPGLHPSAAEWLSERKVKMVGIDLPSIDYGQSQDFKSHQILAQHNIPALEHLANLDQLPANNIEVIALPLKIKDGSGAPARVIARIK